MNHLNDEIKTLKTDILEMWHLVMHQLHKSREAIINLDKGLVHDISANEKRIDAFELKLNMDCENILALFNPLANDLRFVLSVLKITYNLERIGDYAWGIARFVNEAKEPFKKEVIEELKIIGMFETALEMLQDAYVAFEKEDNKMARTIFKKDIKLDDANKNANNIIAKIIVENPIDSNNTLNLLSVIRKLERVGDQTLNISEEIIFYIEAKVLKHSIKKNLI